MVYTSKGYKPIEEIEIGDRVLTHKNRFMPVVDIGSKLAPVINIKPYCMLPAECTEDHPFYSRARTNTYNPKTKGMIKSLREPEWVEAIDLEPIIDHVGFNQIRYESNPHNLSKEDCWLLGRYVADGHCSIRKRYGRKNSYHYSVIYSIGAQKLDEFKVHVIERKFTSYPHTKNTYRCCFYSKAFCDLIDKIELGHGALNKQIPPSILNLPNALLEAFLEGYFSGDGHKTDTGVQCTTVSLKLALGLQLAILKVYGVNASVGKVKTKKFGIIEGRIVNQHQQYTVSFHYKNADATVGRLIDEQMWVPIKDKDTNTHKAIVYNITVDEDHSYTVNNIIVHNCTHWSIAQTNNRETEPSGIGWELFKNYLIAKEKWKPDYFLYENNKSASEAIKNQIKKELGVYDPEKDETDNGVRFTYINSALVSAQNRQRFYVTNCGDIEQPEDRGILLKDVLDGAVALREKAHAVISSAGRTTDREYFIKNQGNMAAEEIKPLSENEMDYMIRDHQDRRWSFTNKPGEEDKSVCLVANVHKGVPYNVLAEPVCVAERGRYNEEGAVEQHFEARDDNKTNTLTTVEKDNRVAEPIQVGALPRPNGELSTSQAFRIYDTEGKSVTLKAQGGGSGAKTGLYAESVEIPNMPVTEATVKGYTEIECGDCVDLSMPKSKTRRGRNMADKANCLTTSTEYYQYVGYVIEFDNDGKPVKAIGKDGKEITIYEVKDGKITIKGKQYPIKLVDGYYIIRKLTVSECKRLQTVPDWYVFPVSNSQAYKMLGNGWTVEVIKHLLSHIPNIQNEEIEVLSMYDGMSCGRIALEEMGCNVVKYTAYEIDKYAIQTTQYNFPDTIQMGDAFAVRDEDWHI